MIRGSRNILGGMIQFEELEMGYEGTGMGMRSDSGFKGGCF